MSELHDCADGNKTLNQVREENGLNLIQAASAPLPLTQQPNIGRTLLEPLNHGLAAAERKALELGVPAHEIIGMLLNHLSSVVAMVEPSGAREALIRQMVADFAPMCRKHIEARFTSPGGVKLPRIGELFKE